MPAEDRGWFGRALRGLLALPGLVVWLLRPEHLDAPPALPPHERPRRFVGFVGFLLARDTLPEQPTPPAAAGPSLGQWLFGIDRLPAPPASPTATPSPSFIGHLLAAESLPPPPSAPPPAKTGFWRWLGARESLPEPSVTPHEETKHAAR